MPETQAKYSAGALQPVDARWAAGCPPGAPQGWVRSPASRRAAGASRRRLWEFLSALYGGLLRARLRPTALTPSPPAAHPQPPPSDLPGEARRSLSLPQVSPPAIPPFPHPPPPPPQRRHPSSAPASSSSRSPGNRGNKSGRKSGGTEIARARERRRTRPGLFPKSPLMAAEARQPRRGAADAR
ncbi:WAS/WASL-interacting protein family member 3-like [Mustela putorius furo]|uniref:WAS/WASL-interacting protein family member 3-like n=1 Tax=Mustela putorius furo TaxID=9669 RepID=A0A8U0SP04_MUSPF|nr:WAS/WASL-interacting protein family member 3-like [Mustela putorius furo]